MKTARLAMACVAGAAAAGILLGVAATLYYPGEAAHGQNRIRIAYFPNVGHAIPIVGMEKGFFERGAGNQTRIEARVFDSGPQAIESLFAGSVDLAYVGPGPAINGHLNSEDRSIRILAGAASGGTSLVVRPDAGIASVSDFGGKRIAAPQIGNTQDVSLRHALAEHGLAPAERGGSVVVYNIANPDIYTLFAKGEIDGAWVAEPWATILVLELGGHRLFHEEDLWPGGEFASVLLVGDVRRVGGNEQAVAGILEAHRDTADWINANPAEARAVFNGFIDSYLGQPLPDDVVDTALSNILITADPKPESVRVFAERADALGYLGRGGSPDLSGIFYRAGGHGGDGDGDIGVGGYGAGVGSTAAAWTGPAAGPHAGPRDGEGGARA